MLVLSPKLAMLSLQQGDWLLPETTTQNSLADHFKEEAKQLALFFQKEKKSEHKVAA